MPAHSLTKGQAAITDLFIAISIFIILVTITTLTWDLYRIQLTNRLDYDDMVVKSFQISDALIKSEGTPENWHLDPQNAQAIGLIEREKHLSTEKVNAFITNLTYNNITDILEINLYNFYFTIKDPNGTIIRSKGTIPTGKYNVNLARIIVYNNKPHIMEFSLWK